MSYELTEPAVSDIRDILTETLKTFGTRQLAVYADLIDRAITMVGQNPEQPGSIDRSEIAPGVRLFHLQMAARRRGAASHCVYYTSGRLRSGAVGTIVLRVLHEKMEPRYRVIRTLRPLAAAERPKRHRRGKPR